MGTFTDIAKNQQNTADNFVDVSSVKQILKKSSEDIHIIEGPMIVQTRDVASSTIWDINYWDAEDSFWNETYEQGFFLDSDSLGVLGTNVLGEAGSAVTLYVVNPENRYYTLFTEDQFEDTANTDATWGPSGLVFTDASTQTGQSLPCAYNDGTVFRATVEAEGADASSLDFKLSADGGSNWETVALGVAHDFTNQGTDLRFKIDNNTGTTGGGWPTLFETWGDAGGVPINATVTKMTIKYEVL